MRFGFHMFMVDPDEHLELARTADEHRRLCIAFEERRVRKTYVAFTAGVPAGREGRIVIEIEVDAAGALLAAAPRAGTEGGVLAEAAMAAVRRAAPFPAPAAGVGRRAAVPVRVRMVNGD